jgi:hypothetical protein
MKFSHSKTSCCRQDSEQIPSRMICSRLRDTISYGYNSSKHGSHPTPFMVSISESQISQIAKKVDKQ